MFERSVEIELIQNLIFSEFLDVTLFYTCFGWKLYKMSVHKVKYLHFVKMENELQLLFLINEEDIESFDKCSKEIVVGLTWFKLFESVKQPLS